MDDAVRQRIKAAGTFALALDTSVIQENGFGFNHGLLALVANHGGNGATVLLPDVIQREVLLHLKGHLSDAAETVAKAAKSVRRWDLLTLRELERLDRLADRARTGAEKLMAHSFDEWLKKADADVLDASTFVKAGDLNRLYFETRPPFEDKEPKKHEFPDAIALLTLEGWAEMHDLYVVAVSNDGGWFKYGASSERVIVTRDLVEVLGMLQGPTIHTATRALRSSIVKGKELGLIKAISDALCERGAISFKIEAQSPYQFQVHNADVTPAYSDIAISTAPADFEAVGETSHGPVVRIRATASLQVTCVLDFVRLLASSGEYVPMGTGTYSDSRDNFQFEALVALGGKIPAAMHIDHVDILPQTIVIPVSDAMPDWIGVPQLPESEGRSWGEVFS